MCNVEASDLERLTADEDDHDLASNHDNVDDDEEKVAMYPFEDVELVVKAPIVELIEDLHPNESIEDHGIQFGLKLLILDRVLEDCRTAKIHHKCHDELVCSLSDDHLPHVRRDERSTFGRWFAIQDLLRRCVSRKSKSREGVHDQVYPQQLNC